MLDMALGACVLAAESPAADGGRKRSAMLGTVSTCVASPVRNCTVAVIPGSRATVGVVHYDNHRATHHPEIVRKHEQLRRREAGRDRLAHIERALDHHAIDGGVDAGVGKVLLGPLEGDARRREVAARQGVVGACAVELRFRHDLLVVERRGALELLLGLRQLRLGAGQPGLGVLEGLALQDRIDARDELPSLHTVVEVGAQLRNAATSSTPPPPRRDRGKRS
ncbi:MAG: hypothetical protein O9271_10520 [Gemmatimonas sp.]|nr:hypothetical protein [Gemmatimonas sp.]